MRGIMERVSIFKEKRGKKKELKCYRRRRNREWERDRLFAN
jgi:hypothetical protein